MLLDISHMLTHKKSTLYTLMMLGVSLLIAGFYTNPFDFGTLIYSIFLGGIIATIGYRFGLLKMLLFIVTFVLIQYFYIQNIPELLKVSQQTSKLLLFTVGSLFLFYGICQLSSNYRLPICILGILATAIIIAFSSVKLYALTHATEGLGEGLIMLFIGSFTFFTTLIFGLIYVILKK